MKGLEAFNGLSINELLQVGFSEEQVRDRLVLFREEGRAVELQIHPQAGRGQRARRVARRPERFEKHFRTLSQQVFLVRYLSLLYTMGSQRATTEC